MSREPLSLEALRTRLRRRQILLAITLVLLLAALFAADSWKVASALSDFARAVSAEPTRGMKAPHDRQVAQLMAELSYSALPMLEREEVFVAVDWGQRTWTLRNLHRFQADGELILERDRETNIRSGTCGELAASLHAPVRELFGPRYQVDFVKAAQSGFFLAPQASHIVLRITPLDSPEGPQRSYILDPSFRRYGPVEEFEDYLFFESASSLPFLEQKQPDITLPIRCYVPLLMREDYLLSLGLEDSAEKLDRDNFVIGLGLTKKHTYSGRYVYALRRQEGQLEVVESRQLGVRLLGEESYKRLRSKVSVLFEKLLQQ